jgi:hypothetical protein
MALLNGPGFNDQNGKTMFAYSHPLFWAPESIIGDGGGAEVQGRIACRGMKYRRAGLLAVDI